MDYVMFQKIDKNLIYYGVYDTPSESWDGSDILCSARKRFFETGKKQKNRGNLKKDAEIYHYSYVMENNVSLRYRKLKKDGKQLERVFDTPGGYYVETLNEQHKPVKRAFFDKRHLWLKTEVLSPVDKTVIRKISPATDHDQPVLILKSPNSVETLCPFLVSLDRSLTEQLNIIAGEPPVFCVTSKGSFYFCTKEAFTERQKALEYIMNKIGDDDTVQTSRSSFVIDTSKLENNPTAGLDLSSGAEIHVSSDTNANSEKERFFSQLEAIARQSSETDFEEKILRNESHIPETPTVTEESKPPVFKEETVSVSEAIPENTEEAAGSDTAEFPTSEQTYKPVSYEKICTFAQECPYQTVDKQIIESGGRQYFYFGSLDGTKRHGKGRTTMKNGETAYEGQYADDKRDGFGTYYYKSGKLCYAGHWRQNHREGLGVAFSPTDESAFIGEWHQDRSVNVGATFDSQGKLLYVGNVDNDKKHGAGITYNEQDKTFFVGKYKDGEFLCTGTQFSSEGDLLYTGGYKDNRRTGTGTSYNADGTVQYQGEWLNNLYHGEGVLYLENGGMLKGTFRQGKAYGNATLTDQNGKIIYTGGFADDVYSGTGRLFSDDGGFAEGIFADGEPTGIFNEYTADKQLIYCGEWTDMHRNGRGIAYRNGEKIYEGEFKNSLYNGKGKQIENGTLVYMGMFADGQRNGYGIEFKNNEMHYQGMWKDNLYDGSGILFEDSETRYIGLFKAGKREGRINEIADRHIIRKSLYENDNLVYMCEYSHEGTLLYYGSVSNNMRNGMGCTFLSACEKQFEGIFRNGQPEKAMKVFLKELDEIPPCSELADTDYELYRETPVFVIEKPMTVGQAQGIYTGKLTDGLPDGEATVLYADHRYTGGFTNGLPDGSGIIYRHDGSEIHGTFCAEPFENCQTLTLSDMTYYYLE